VGSGQGTVLGEEKQMFSLESRERLKGEMLTRHGRAGKESSLDLLLSTLVQSTASGSRHRRGT
jgi:hypothetical protein